MYFHEWGSPGIYLLPPRTIGTEKVIIQSAMRTCPTFLFIRFAVAVVLVFRASGVCWMANCAWNYTSPMAADGTRPSLSLASASPVSACGPSSAEHGCCRPSTGIPDNTPRAWLPNADSTTWCCQPMDQVSDHHSKSRGIDRASFVPAAALPFSFGNQAGTFRLLDKGRTYQRCCVLLI